jgi:vancomycin permeability regulator SanA
MSMTEGNGTGDGAPPAGTSLRVTPLRAVALIVALSMLYMLFTFADIWFATQRSTEGMASAAVVLGAAQYDGTPSPVLLRRLDEAASLYDLERVGLIVVTGGGQQGDRTTEAKAGYDYLRALGIPDEDLRLEVQGVSTYSSIAAAARFLRSEGIDDVILVTDAYHTRRVEMIASEVGLEAQVSPVGDAGFSPMIRETAAVAAGRVIGFRRLDALIGR